MGRISEQASSLFGVPHHSVARRTLSHLPLSADLLYDVCSERAFAEWTRVLPG
jgi:hypothetical protein